MGKHSQPASYQPAQAATPATGRRFAPATPSNQPADFSRSAYASPYDAPHANASHQKGRHGGGANGSRHTIRYAILGALIALVVLIGVYAALLINSAMNVMDQVKTLVPTAERVVSAVKSGDTSTLQADIQSLQSGVDALQDETSTVVWDIATIVPVYGQDVANARTLLGIADDALTQIVVPLTGALAANPLSSLIQSGNINGGALSQLCNTVADVTPAIKSALTAFSEVDEFHISQINDALDQVREPLNMVNTLLDENGEVIRMLPSLLGCNGARTYLVIAQNNAEIRATGGLPGAFIPVTVDNGVISFGEVSGLEEINTISDTPLEITSEEWALFGNSLGTTPANMTYTPDFSRAASLLVQAWQLAQGQYFDAVISVDPLVFQRLIGLVGGSATLSNGITIDGTNAAQVLISDAYWYFGNDYESSDAFFAEAASVGLGLVRDNLGSLDFSELLTTVADSIDGGRILAWSANPEEEALFEQLGCAGTLNTDPTAPELGVFVNDNTWSKIDWYLDLNTVINSSQKDADGSTSYQVTTQLTNLMTPEEAETSPAFITGYNPDKIEYSDILTTLYLYAPAGGSISNVSFDGSTASNIPEFSEGTHNGLQVVFGATHLLSGETLSVTYTVTTSPQAAADLTVRSTPSPRG